MALPQAKSQGKVQDIRTLGRFLGNVKYNILSNATFAGLFLGLDHIAPCSSLKEKIAFGTVCKLGAELSDLMLYGEHGLLKEFSAANNPLDFSAYLADGIRSISKKWQELRQGITK